MRCQCARRPPVQEYTVKTALYQDPPQAPWTALFPGFSWSFAVGKTPQLKNRQDADFSATASLTNQKICAIV